MDTLLTIGAVAGVIAAVLAALFGIVKLVRGTARTLRRIVFIHNAVAELLPNGGTSIKDAVGRIEKRLTALEEGLGVNPGG